MSQTKPTAPSADKNTHGLDTEPSVGAMRVRQMPGYDYLHITRETTLNGMDKLTQIELPRLFATMKEKGIQPSGSVVFTYHNATGNRNQKFVIDMGIQVTDLTTAPAGYLLTHVAPTQCATVLYGGNLATIGLAYKEIFTNLSMRDLIPTGETREYFLAWDDAKSVNNVVWIAACAE